LKLGKMKNKLAKSVKHRVDEPKTMHQWTSTEISNLLQEEGGKLSLGVQNALESF